MTEMLWWTKTTKTVRWEVSQGCGAQRWAQAGDTSLFYRTIAAAPARSSRPAKPLCPIAVAAAPVCVDVVLGEGEPLEAGEVLAADEFCCEVHVAAKLVALRHEEPAVVLAPETKFTGAHYCPIKSIP